MAGGDGEFTQKVAGLRHGCAKIAENRPRNLVRPT